MKKYIPILFILITPILSGFLRADSFSQTLEESAENIAADVGIVVDVIEGDPERVVYIFEERHNSILDQIQIAVMFNRLYAHQGLRHIGLEGAPVAGNAIALSWAHGGESYQPDQPITSREDVLVQMAQDGILNNAELIGLVYQDIQVHGIDDASLYALNLSNPNLWYVPYDYTYQIALIMMEEADLNAWKELMSANEAQMAFEFAMKTCPYGREVIERLRSGLSAEEFIELMDELVAKGDEEVKKRGLKMNQTLIAAKDELLSHMEVVVARSEAMAAAMLELIDAHPGAPLAMTTGDMHGDRIVEILAAAGISVVWLHPLALAEGEQVGLMSKEAFERFENGFSPTPDDSMGALLDGRKKPPPAPPQRISEEFRMRFFFQFWMDQYLKGLKRFLIEHHGFDSNRPETYSDALESFSNLTKDEITQGWTYYTAYAPHGVDRDKQPADMPVLSTADITVMLNTIHHYDTPEGSYTIQDFHYQIPNEGSVFGMIFDIAMPDGKDARFLVTGDLLSFEKHLFDGLEERLLHEPTAFESDDEWEFEEKEYWRNYEQAMKDFDDEDHNSYKNCSNVRYSVLSNP